MLVQFGNTAPLEDGVPQERDAPCVTYANLHDYKFQPGANSVGDVKMHLADAIVTRQGVTHLPGQEALIAVVHPTDGIVAKHTNGKPSWIWSDSPDLAKFLGEYYGCPVGIPEGVEDTHHTMSGPPGVVPGAGVDPQMNITQNGRDIVARALGGGVVGRAGVSTTGPGATTYTLDGVGAPGSTTAYTGQRIIAGSTAVGCVWGNVISNTNAAPPVLTVDRWYNPATPGGAAATTPVAGPWAVIDGAGPAWFVGLSASTSALASPSTNTSLPSEITTGGGGLIRQIAPFAHTASLATWTLTPVYTANGSDSLPVTIGSYGTFNSAVVGDTTQTMLHNGLLGTTATLSLSGDALTLTITVTTT